MATCLVTGGAGFIGSHLVEALIGDGHHVRVLDNLSTGHLVNLAGVRNRFEMIEGDVCDLDAVRRATRGADRVFHFAALPSIPRGVADPIGVHQVCATGTLHVLTAALETDVGRVVYASSSSVYGRSDRPAKRETDPPAPLCPYSAAKLAGEQYGRVFGEAYGLEVVRLRFFNIFGPRQKPGGPYAGAIPAFLDAMLAGDRPVVFGDGAQSRDFTHVDNAVRASVLAATSRTAAGRVYNVACGRSIALLDVVAQINDLLGTRLAPAFTPPRLVELRHSLADITRARSELGYEPTVGFEDGLRRCLAYHRNRQATGLVAH